MSDQSGMSRQRAIGLIACTFLASAVVASTFVATPHARPESTAVRASIVASGDTAATASLLASEVRLETPVLETEGLELSCRVLDTASPSVDCGFKHSETTEERDRREFLEKSLRQMNAAGNDLHATSIRSTLVSSLAIVLDSQGRGIPRAQHSHRDLRIKNGWETFVYNGTMYTFLDEEFPEYVEYLKRRDTNVSADDAARIVTAVRARAAQALALPN
jgi:hypothetical protein